MRFFNRLYNVKIKPGNLIAAFLLTPVIIVMYLLFSREYPKHDRYEGYLFVALTMGIIIFTASLFYLIFANINYIDNSKIGRWLYRNRYIIRKIAIVAAILKMLSLLFFPNKHIPSRKSDPITRFSLRD